MATPTALQGPTPPFTATTFTTTITTSSNNSLIISSNINSITQTTTELVVQIRPHLQLLASEAVSNRPPRLSLSRTITVAES